MKLRNFLSPSQEPGVRMGEIISIHTSVGYWADLHKSEEVGINKTVLEIRNLLE